MKSLQDIVDRLPRLKPAMSMACHWLTDVAQVKSDEIPVGENTFGLQHTTWNGAFRGEYHGLLFQQTLSHLLPSDCSFSLFQMGKVSLQFNRLCVLQALTTYSRWHEFAPYYLSFRLASQNG